MVYYSKLIPSLRPVKCMNNQRRNLQIIIIFRYWSKNDFFLDFTEFWKGWMLCIDNSVLNIKKIFYTLYSYWPSDFIPSTVWRYRHKTFTYCSLNCHVTYKEMRHYTKKLASLKTHMNYCFLITGRHLLGPKRFEVMRF